MAIRFRCGSCSQPIEIDDEWASKTVACPYCRKTITAPAESTLTDMDAIPTATPMTREVDPPPVPGYEPFPEQEPVHPNKIAIVALILGLVSIASIVGSSTIMASHSDEWKELEKIVSSDGDFNDRMTAQNQYLQDNPDIVKWLLPAGMLMILGWMASLAAIICGVIGARRPNRRGPAVVGLVIASLVPVLSCGGFFMS